jgi:SAM-dependent methyltransferase
MLTLARGHNLELRNVEWLRGDGTSLAGIPSASVDCCVSHVVFQHIPDPEITLGYVMEMGRVLRRGGWAGFQISNDPSIHRPEPPLRRLRRLPDALAGRVPRGLAHPAWLGSAVEVDDVETAALRGGMKIERVVGEATQFCLIRTRRL